MYIWRGLYLFKKSVRRLFFILSLKLWTVILDFSDRVIKWSRLFQIVKALYKKHFWAWVKGAQKFELKELKVGRIVTFSVDLRLISSYALFYVRLRT
jgi:hypothetical protein